MPMSSLPIFAVLSAATFASTSQVDTIAATSEDDLVNALINTPMLLNEAFVDFKTSIASIQVECYESLYEIKELAYEVEIEAWHDTVDHVASHLTFDGFTLSDIYPYCVEQMQAGYDP